MEDLVNKTLGQFQIRRELGRGGMAVVYEAYQPALQRTVALKVLPPSLSHDAAFVRRFQQEAIAAAGLRHTNIVTIYDVGSQGPFSFIVMEYLEGKSLADVIRAGGPLPLARASKILEQVAHALDYAHQRGFIHRDIKPGNVMVAADDHATLTDFGIARAMSGTHLTQTGTIIGTPEYMAPEQIRGSEVDHRVDIYALGIVAYEMLTGHVPFSGTTASVLYKQVNEPPPPLTGLVSQVPPHVIAALARALTKEPSQRFQTSSEFAAAFSGARPVAAPPPIPPTRPMDQAQAQPYTTPPQAVYAPTAPTVQQRPRGTPGWVVWLVGGIAAVLLVCAVALGVAFVAQNIAKPSPTAGASMTTPGVTVIHSTQVVVISATPDKRPIATTPPPPPPTRTQPPPPPPTPTTYQPRLTWTNIGQSVQERDLSVASIGNPSKIAVVVVGSIQGDQAGTRDLVNALIAHLERNPTLVPSGVAYYFMPSLNPDGNALNSRYNANGVDLNRNWDSQDWRSDPAVPEQPSGKAGAGGSRPLSEPESRALRDFIFTLQPQGTSLRLVVVHSSMRRTSGQVYPGGNDSIDLAQVYASTASYDVETSWAEYTTSGELVTWGTEQGYLSIDIVVPASQGPSSQVSGTGYTLLELTLRALEAVASYR